MKILIIGSKGFIGHHCTQYFSKDNEVWGCDVVQDVLNERYYQITDAQADFNSIFQMRQYDVCINCSGAANVSYSLQHPLHDYTLNTINVYRILDAIRVYNAECKYISMSSAAVYGNPEYIPIDEKHPLAPISPYGYHKVYAEEIMREFHRFWKLKVCCIRIFSAYGPGLRKQLLWDIAEKASKGGKVELFGTGDETRDFICVFDLVRLIDCVIKQSPFDFDVVNAANGVQISVGQIAHLMIEKMQTGNEIVFNGAVKAGDPLNWEANIDKSSKYGYTQSVDIEAGIELYVKWYNKLMADNTRQK